jgi:CheY-like chemotaxis protein
MHSHCAPSPSVLIVERDPSLAETLRIAFESAGHEPLVVDGLPEALDALVHLPGLPRRVVIDISAPYPENWELVEAIRQHPDWRELELTLLTTHAACPKLRERSRYHGLEFDDDDSSTLLPMPFELEDLIRVGSGEGPASGLRPLVCAS